MCTQVKLYVDKHVLMHASVYVYTGEVVCGCMCTYVCIMHVYIGEVVCGYKCTNARMQVEDKG